MHVDYPEQKYTDGILIGSTIILTGGSGYLMNMYLNSTRPAREQSQLKTVRDNIETLQKSQTATKTDSIPMPHTNEYGVSEMKAVAYKDMITEQQHKADQIPAMLKQSDNGAVGGVGLIALLGCVLVTKMFYSNFVNMGHDLARKFSPNSYWDTIRPGD